MENILVSSATMDILLLTLDLNPHVLFCLTIKCFFLFNNREIPQKT